MRELRVQHKGKPYHILGRGDQLLLTLIQIEEKRGPYNDIVKKG